jgi:hypothetical protein
MRIRALAGQKKEICGRALGTANSCNNVYTCVNGVECKQVQKYAYEC